MGTKYLYCCVLIVSQKFIFAQKASEEFLAQNLFANLEADPLIQGKNISVELEQYVDKKIETFLKIIKTSHEKPPPARNRRDILPWTFRPLKNDPYGIFVPKNVSIEHIEKGVLIDSQFLRQCKANITFEYWVKLIANKSDEHAFELVVEEHGLSDHEILKVPVTKGVKIGLHTSTTNTSTFIVVAEYSSIRENLDEKTAIYQLQSHELRKIQSIDVNYAIDAIMWEVNGRIFMAIASEKTLKNNSVSYATESPIFSWQGGHFDIMNNINTFRPKKLTAFTIRDMNFLAVVNYQNDFGETNIYSEIYKYNLDSDKFILHQRILTSGAIDVQYFCFKEDYRKEEFLVITNSPNTTKLADIYTANTVIYKFIDNYFIPFQSFDINGIIEWVPIIGARGEFALLANTETGIRNFQYDGWRYTETIPLTIPSTNETRIFFVSSYTHSHNNPRIVVAEPKKETISIYALEFDNRNPLKSYHATVLDWCYDMLDNLAQLASEQGMTLLQLRNHSRPLVSENLISVRSARVQGEDSIDAAELNNLKVIQQKLIIEYENLKVIEKDLTKLEDDSEIDSLYVNELILNSDKYSDVVSIGYLNGKSVSEFLDDIIPIKDEILSKVPININEIKFENKIQPAIINNHKTEDIVQLDDDIFFNQFVIEGNAVFENGINVEGRLNNLSMSKKQMLLNEGDQILEGNLISLQIQAKNIQANKINELPLENVNLNVTSQSLTHLNNIDAKHLVVAGFVNNIDINLLNRNVLKAQGNQKIIGNYHFNSLEMNNLITEYLSDNQIPNSLVATKGTHEHIKYDVEFIDELELNNLTISYHLNHIRSFDGKLGILLKDSKELQKVSGYKLFQNIELMDDIKLRGRIKNNVWEKMNPVRNIEDEITVAGDFNLTGNITIEKSLIAKYIENENGNYSLTLLESQGLKLNENVPVHLLFEQQLNMEEIFVDRVNNIEADSWIHSDSNETQIINGNKIFLQDVYLSGSTDINNINGINLSELEFNVLRINGDQFLTGNHQIVNMFAQRIDAKKSKIGGKSWNDILIANKLEFLPGTTVIKNNVNINSINASKMFVKENINGLNVDYMLKDSVFKYNTSNVNGVKLFQNITIENLTVNYGVNMKKLPSILNKPMKIESDIKFPENFIVNNIYFDHSLNGILKTDFSLNPQKHCASLVFDGARNFERIVVYQDTYIRSNFINHLNITEVHQNSIKMNEPFQFETLNLENIVSNKPIILHGHINRMDINNIVTESEKEIITDEKTFHENVIIEGYLYVEELVNGINITELCNFAFPIPNEEPKKLFIDGNAYFSKGPKILQLYDYEVQEIYENVWFSDKETIFNGYLDFIKIIFENNVHVQGLVGNTDLAYLSANYLSKTKNQTIQGHLDFTEGVSFQNYVYAKEAVLEGQVHGINLNEFIRTALLNDIDQIFEKPILLETCEILDLQGEYLVNNFNLQNDMVRYNAPNIITGEKIFKNLYTNLLKINNNSRIKNVDFLNWIQTAILREGNFNIRASTIFNAATTFKHGIGSNGLVNGLFFNEETILLKNTPQDVTGRKTFSKLVQFKNVTLKGVLNNIELANLINVQAYKNTESTFLSPINFNDKIITSNTNINKLYQGVNMSLLLNNLTRFVAFNNYNKNYAYLFDVVTKIRSSLESQAYYLNFYKNIQVLNHRMVLPVKINGEDKLVGLTSTETCDKLNFYVWDNTAMLFVPDENSPMIEFNKRIVHMNVIEFRQSSFLYTEVLDNIEEASYKGNIFQVRNASSFEVIHDIDTNETIFLKAVTLPDTYESCLLFACNKNTVKLLCEDGNDKLFLHQELPTRTAKEASTMMIDGILYLYIINAANDNEESCVEIWKFERTLRKFVIHNIIYVLAPTSLATVTYKGSYYLSIASSLIKNTIYSGQVDIRKYDKKTEKFVTLQELKVNVPVDVQFSILPSDELLLYILTENPTEPFAFMYEGIFGFVQKIFFTTTININSLTHFTDQKKQQHFLLAQNEEMCTVIQGVFKGRHGRG